MWTSTFYAWLKNALHLAMFLFFSFNFYDGLMVQIIQSYSKIFT